MAQHTAASDAESAGVCGEWLLGRLLIVRQNLRAPGIVQRNEPTPIGLTAKDIGGFPIEKHCLPGGVSAAQAPTCYVQRDVVRLEDGLCVGPEYGLDRDEAGQRVANFGSAAGELAWSHDEDSVGLIERHGGCEVAVIDRLHKVSDGIDRCGHG